MFLVVLSKEILLDCKRRFCKLLGYWERVEKDEKIKNKLSLFVYLFVDREKNIYLNDAEK